MKKILALFSAIIFINCICHAQIDSTKKTADSITSKVKPIVQKDTVVTKTPADTPNYSLLYVYRPKDFVGAMLNYDLKIVNSHYKDSVVCRVKNNSKFKISLYQEGKTELWAKTEAKKSVFIDVKFGQKYYIKCGIDLGFFVGRPELILVEPSQGAIDYDGIVIKSK